MLPAGVIDRIDYEHRAVRVDRDGDDIKNAPEYEPDGADSEAYRTGLGAHYSNSE